MLAMAYSCVGKAQTTIGAGGLNCRVRDGTGCTPTALITNINSPCQLVKAGRPGMALRRHAQN